MGKLKLKKVGKLLLKITPVIITIASILAAVTPNDSDDKIVKAAHQIFDAITLDMHDHPGPSQSSENIHHVSSH